MCNLWRIPATCAISRLSAKSESQNVTNAKCDTEEHYVDLWFSPEDLVQPAINGLRFHVEHGDRLSLHDSSSWLNMHPCGFISVFHIVSTKNDNGNGNCRITGSFKACGMGNKQNRSTDCVSNNKGNNKLWNVSSKQYSVGLLKMFTQLCMEKSSLALILSEKIEVKIMHTIWPPQNTTTREKWKKI